VEVFKAKQGVPSVCYNPLRIIQGFWGHRELILQLTTREISQRYRGTYLGIFWSFITPLLMLSIYTFVFSIILKAKWADHVHPMEGIAQFAMTLYAGIIPFTVFSETANRASTIISGVPNYVKKVVFPLEILPLVIVSGVLVHSLISIGILIVLTLLLMGICSYTVFLLPLVYAPLIFLCLGLSWFLASLGVYVRDIKHGVEILVQMLLFLSPVLYPATLVPEPFRIVLHINPLTSILNEFRRILLWNEYPDWGLWGLWTVATFFLAFAGYLWFMKTKDGFADIM
jgi:lipopolysaccharide transport system permease protein